MPKVYISSTYEDLKDVRRRVIEAIRKVPGHEPVSMEHYGADDRRPLDRCLADVRRSDIYIGILGSRSGFVPKGQQKSITRLEYDAAFEAKRPCFCFLMEATTSNPDKDDARRIDEFRALVRDRHVCCSVNEATPIGEEVMKSLIERAFADPNVGANNLGDPKRTLLPFTCDRKHQQQELALKLLRGGGRELAPHSDSIPICIVHGSPEQAPEKFAEWLAERLYQEILLVEGVAELKFEWPIDTRTSQEFGALLLGNLWRAAQLAPPHDSSREALARELSMRQLPFILSTELSLDYWHPAEKSRLEMMCDFFDGWSEPINPPRGVLVWVTYKEAVPRRGWFFRRPSSVPAVNSAVRKALEQLITSRPSAKLLSELGNVREDDALAWAKHPDVLSRVRNSDVTESVREIFRQAGLREPAHARAREGAPQHPRRLSNGEPMTLPYREIFDPNGVKSSRPRSTALVESEKPSLYLPDEGVVHAVNTALLLGRPLLVTGEPGTGKTQLAGNVAVQLGLSPPLVFVAKSISQAQDVFYTFDDVGRLKAAPGADEAEARRYIRYNALGEAILRSHARERIHKFIPNAANHVGPVRSVVLIDEIDKAPRDFPNDLLSELDRMSFRVPEIHADDVEAAPDMRPIVIITSNSERALPDAFLRRCIYYDIPFPPRARLEKILEARLGQCFDSGFAKDSLDLLERLRDDALGLAKKPSTAEVVGWMTALLRRDDLERSNDAVPLPNPLRDRKRALQTLGALVKTREDLKRARVVVERWIQEGR